MVAAPVSKIFWPAVGGSDDMFVADMFDHALFILGSYSKAYLFIIT